MELLLNNDDLNLLDGLIKKTPFEFAQPLFQFFSGKIQEAHAKAQTKQSEAAIPAQTEEVGAEVVTDGGDKVTKKLKKA